ncbi:MAG: hypothetical protein ABSE36_17735, partial [Terracidiphilus sp.]
DANRNLELPPCKGIASSVSGGCLGCLRRKPGDHCGYERRVPDAAGAGRLGLDQTLSRANGPGIEQVNQGEGESDQGQPNGETAMHLQAAADFKPAYRPHCLASLIETGR